MLALVVLALWFGHFTVSASLGAAGDAVHGAASFGLMPTWVFSDAEHGRPVIPGPGDVDLMYLLGLGLLAGVAALLHAPENRAARAGRSGTGRAHRRRRRPAGGVRPDAVLAPARPADWTAAVVVVAIGLSVAFVRAGLADDIAGSINAGRLVAAVLSIGVAAAFLDPVAPVSDAAPTRASAALACPPALSLAALAVAGAALAIAQAARVAGVPWPAMLLPSRRTALAFRRHQRPPWADLTDPGILAAITVVGLISLDAPIAMGTILTAAPGDAGVGATSCGRP